MKQYGFIVEVALGCGASAIIYRKTRFYGDYQWILDNRHKCDYSAVDFAADCHLYFIRIVTFKRN